jgi:endonuclease YncB( thermonuclease family)
VVVVAWGAIFGGCGVDSTKQPVAQQPASAEPAKPQPLMATPTPAVAPAIAAQAVVASPAAKEPTATIEKVWTRNWSDRKGSHHVTAALVDYQNSVAYLKKESGHIVPVPTTRLSDSDHAFIAAKIRPVKVITGKVVSITDGDTILVMDGTEARKIRLEGIDAPESRQAFGTQAKEALADLIFQKDVRIEWREYDKYHRVLGHVFVGDKWVNQQLLRDGYAWHYKEYSTSPVLALDEQLARSEKAGLWSDKEPIAPWIFRHSEENKPKPIVAAHPPAAPPKHIVNKEPTYVAPERSSKADNSDGEVHVRGYYRKNGTYVEPHTRSRPHKK